MQGKHTSSREFKFWEIDVIGQSKDERYDMEEYGKACLIDEQGKLKGYLSYFQTSMLHDSVSNTLSHARPL